MRPGVSFLLAALAITPAPRVAAAADLQPHEALYRLTLDRAQGDSDVVSATGMMFYRFTRVCDGWTVENRTFLRLFYADDTEADTVWSFASWEAANGRTFRFHTRYDQDGNTLEKLSGVAERHRRGGVARFADPATEIALPAGTLFPTEHLRRLLDAAEAGRHRLGVEVFDGASLDNPYLVNAWFGPLSTEAQTALAAGLHLPDQPAWWTRIAFHPAGSTDAEPEFEMSAQYRADGIADHIVQQFPTFSLDVRIMRLALLPQPDC